MCLTFFCKAFQSFYPVAKTHSSFNENEWQRTKNKTDWNKMENDSNFSLTNVAIELRWNGSFALIYKTVLFIGINSSVTPDVAN